MEAAHSGFETVAAAGGDGTVHEVANGLLRAARPEVALAIYPLGSANDYAHSLALQRTAAGSSAGGTIAVDVGLVRLGDGRERFFVNSLGLGFSGAVTVESRKIRRLRGLFLYGLALMRVLCRGFQQPIMTVRLDDTSRRGPTLSLTLAIGRREGNFTVAPDALMDDGLFDFLHVGAVTRWQVVRMLPRLAWGKRLPEGYDQIWTGRCRAGRADAETGLTVHLDGELLCVAREQVKEMEASLLPGRLRVRIPS
jgi:diacylglycerol kinase family enzyme